MNLLLGFAIKLIWLVLFLFTTAIWSVVGFIFWIPLLARSTAVFSSLILYVTLTNQDHHALGYQLEIAARFYVDGYRHIYDVFYDGPANPPPSGKPLELEPWGILLVTLWTIGFWVVVSYATGLLWPRSTASAVGRAPPAVAGGEHAGPRRPHP